MDKGAEASPQLRQIVSAWQWKVLKVVTRLLGICICHPFGFEKYIGCLLVQNKTR